MKTIIIGAGLGGLITGLLLKKSKPEDEVVIYDSNKIPGGFCNAFQKVCNIDGEKIKYTINIPVVSSDFNKGEPFDQFLNYMGVKNFDWKVIEQPFEYYPTDDKPFIFTKNGVRDIIERTPEEEKQYVIKFFNKMAKFYNDIFHKANMNPKPFEAIKMLLEIPDSIFTLMQNKTYKKHLHDSKIRTPLMQEIFSVTEGFMGLEVEKASAVGELLMIQSFLQNSLVAPAKGHSFQTLSDRLCERFIELGGKVVFKTKVENVLFDDKKAIGVVINGEKIYSDNVIISTAQDKIKGLIESGKHISKVNSLIKKINKIPYPNSDFYIYYLVDKNLFKDREDYIKTLYHIYKKKGGLGGEDWNLFIILPDELYNEKYYCMAVLYIEHNQEKVDWWMDLREKNYKKYEDEKEKFAGLVLKELQEVEPLFKKEEFLHEGIIMTPASYPDYGSNYPISGLAQNPDNCGMTRMKSCILPNLFISGGASFSAGVWGAIAGGWMGFVTIYEKIYGIKIGNNDVLYKPGLKNLP